MTFCRQIRKILKDFVSVFIWVFYSRSGRRKTMTCFLVFSGFACIFTMFLPTNAGKYVLLLKQMFVNSDQSWQNYWMSISWLSLSGPKALPIYISPSLFLSLPSGAGQGARVLFILLFTICRQNLTVLIEFGRKPLALWRLDQAIMFGLQYRLLIYHLSSLP